ncbi:MAG: glycosyltransferase family 1 protein, partial [Phycisphaerales bacterium]|nr:glycosyltransferase family 1 protein [Phycisphaerales bacterium]
MASRTRKQRAVAGSEPPFQKIRDAPDYSCAARGRPNCPCVERRCKVPTGTVRVASVPAGHVYVRHLAGVDGNDRVLRLPDPRVEGRAIASQWWPPAMLELAWVADHLDDFDVFHIHFGFDAKDPAQLSALVAMLRAAGKPLVYTVHDLRNPHQADPKPHSDHLDVLIPAADAVVTLTPGAARHIERRWGRRVTVLPHPHVVDIARLRRGRRRSKGPFVVGLHAKSLRASMDPLAVLRILTQTLRGLPDSVLRVDVHHDVMDPQGANHDFQLVQFLQASAAAGELSLCVHDYFSDEHLWSYLS